MSIPQLDNAPRCQHTHLSGKPCKAPAKRGTDYCLFHAREHTTPTRDLTFPRVEDAAGIQLAVGQLIDAIAADMIDFRRAALLFAGLRIARANLKQFGLEMGDVVEPPKRKQEEEEDAPSLAEYLLQQLNDEVAEEARVKGLPAPELFDIEKAKAEGVDLTTALIDYLQAEPPAREEGTSA